MNKLAIIIPYYKIDFFEETLKSVANQKDKRFTLYIGNDASPNDPLPLIQKYFPEGNYSYFDYKENFGGKNLALQWERILENVNEEWFQILGDDDQVENNFVEEFYKILKLLPNFINLIRVKNIYLSSTLLPYREGVKYEEISDAKLLLEDKAFCKTVSTLSENIFLKKDFDKVGFRKYPIAWYSDDMIILEITNFDKYYYNSNTSVIIYNGGVNLSSSSSYLKEKFKASQLYICDILKLNKMNQFYINRLLYNLETSNNENFYYSFKLIKQLFISLHIRKSIKLILLNIKNGFSFNNNSKFQ